MTGAPITASAGMPGLSTRDASVTAISTAKTVRARSSVVCTFLGVNSASRAKGWAARLASVMVRD